MHHGLTIEAAESSFISLERAPTAAEVQHDLEMTKLGQALLALLERAAEITRDSDRKWADSVVALRQRDFKPTREARLAEILIDRLGPHDDCDVTREVAERAVAS